MTPQEFAQAFALSSTTLERFELYAALLRKWSPSINLVAKSTLPDLWHRHFADSAQLLAIAPKPSRSWIDLGSGAGFPGMVVAIVSRETLPDLRVTLVESDRRKATFLREVARATDCPVDIRAERVESVTGQFDVISARAFAPLDRLLDLAAPLCAPDTVLLLPKGENCDSELTAASEHWHIGYEKHTSAVDPSGVILRIDSLARRDR